MVKQLHYPSEQQAFVTTKKNQQAINTSVAVTDIEISLQSDRDACSETFQTFHQRRTYCFLTSWG